MSPTSPTERSITERQNDPEHLSRLLAYSHQYRIGRMWRSFRVAGSLALAGASPVVVIWFPHSADMLGAVAAGWLVIGRTVMAAFESHYNSQAVRMQELYETRLFGLDWNPAVAGRAPSPEDVAAAALKMKMDPRYHNWFDVDVTGLVWPADVLLCQRQAAVWARHDHQAYALFVAVIGSAWLIFGLVFAVVRESSLADYLVRLFLPSAPVYLDVVELALAHWRHAHAREELEREISDLWAKQSSEPNALTGAICRRVQDRAFVLRQSQPRVPDLFYRLRRQGMIRSTVEGARELRRES